jgi:hypothetical protein
MLARRRMVGRRLVRATVGTAVIAGTATAVGGAVSHHQQQKYDQQAYDQQQQQMAEQQQYYAPPPPPPQQAPQAPASAESDLMAKINQLAQLHASGVLTDEEFTAAKQKLLTS